MSRSPSLLKIAAPPLVAAMVAYAVAHALSSQIHRSNPPADSATRTAREADTGSMIRGIQDDPKGLAHRRALLALESKPSLATLIRLREAGMESRTYPPEVIRECARKDPEATWRFLIEGPESVRDELTQVVMEEWLHKDPDAITTLLAMTHASSDRQSISTVLLKAIGGADEKLADVALKNLTLIGDDLSMFDTMTATGAPGGVATERLLALPPSAIRDGFLASMAKGWMARDWLGATKWAEAQAPELKQMLMSRMAETAFASKDPNAGPMLEWAVKWLSKDAAPADVSRLGPPYVEALARSQPAAALAWSQEHLAGQPLAQATATIVGIQFASDPDGARQFVANLPAGGVQQAAAAKIANSWAKTNAVAAVSWWLEFPQGATRPLALGNISNEWPKEQLAKLREYMMDPASPPMPGWLAFNVVDMRNGAESFAQAETGSGANREKVLDYSLRFWSEKEPATAAARLSEKPELVNPYRAKQVAKNLYGADRAAALDWVAALPEGASRADAANDLRTSIAKDTRLDAAKKKELLGKLP